MTDAAEQHHKLALARFGGVVRSHLRRYGASSIDLEDLTQEVWLVALSRSPTFSDERATRAWLSQVCRRVMAGARRSRARTPMLRDVDAPELPVDADQSECIERDFDEQKSLAALSRLSEPQLDVLSLYGSGELSMREVADLIGEPEGTVYSRYRAAIDEVSRELRRPERVESAQRLNAPPPPRMPSHPPVIPEDSEAAADRGEFVLYRCDDALVMGRVGNVLVTQWRKRVFEQSADDVGSTIKSACKRLGMPMVMVNFASPELPLPNATERTALRHNIRDTAQQVVMAVDIWDSRFTGLLAAIINGLLMITRSNRHVSFVVVRSAEAGRRWIEPHAKTALGPLSWERVMAAIVAVCDAP